ncbi:MAG: hypothetical protein V4669_16945 [Pseudomonadota bacterium]
MPGSRVNDSSPRTSVSRAYSPGLARNEGKDRQEATHLSLPPAAAPQHALGLHWAISDSDGSQPLLARSPAPDAQTTAQSLGEKFQYAVHSIRMPVRMPLSRSRKAQVVPLTEQRDAQPMTELIRQHDQTYTAILSVVRQIAATRPRNATRDAIDEANRTRDLLKTKLETLKVVRSVQDATMAREGESWRVSLVADGLQGAARDDLEKRIADIEVFRAATQAAIESADVEIAKAREPRNWTVEAGDEARIAGARLEQSKANLVRTLEAIDAQRASLAARWTWVVPGQSVPLQLHDALPAETEIDG